MGPADPEHPLHLPTSEVLPTRVTSDRRAEPRPLIHRLGTVTSTQDEAGERLAAGELAPFAVTAREQITGRGRLGRRFESPEGGSLSVTFVHRSSLDPARRTWIPLLAGLAAIEALATVTGTLGVGLGLKWPNDIHTEDGRKLGGILVEGRGAHGVLIGIGINVAGPVLGSDGSVVPGSAWLLGKGGVRPESGDEALPLLARTEAVREQLEEALVAAIAAELRAFETAHGEASAAGMARRYTMICLTLGRKVRVDPLGETGAGGALSPAWQGTAREIDEHGRLVVDLDGGDRVAVDVGDVRHVRPGGPARPTTDAEPGVEQEEHGT